MLFLLDHLPANLHLVLATRTDPELPLSRLRVRGQLLEIRSSDLRFTQEEATSFLLQRMGLPLSEEDVATLHSRTEGWIAGLQLAALSLRKRQDLSGWVSDFAGSSPLSPGLCAAGHSRAVAGRASALFAPDLDLDPDECCLMPGGHRSVRRV